MPINRPRPRWRPDRRSVIDRSAPKGDATAGSRLRRALLVLVVAVVIAVPAVATPGAGAAAGAERSSSAIPKVDYSGDWRITTKVINDSSHELRLLAATTSEETPWGPSPAPVIPAGTTSPTGSAMNSVAGHGLAVLLTYGAYRPGTDEFVGMVVLKSGINCVGALGIVCTDYHRWEVGACDAGGALGLSWGDNAGLPDRYETWFRVTDGGGGCEGRRTAAEQLPAPTGDEPVPNAPWGVTQLLENRSPFELRLNTYWASEASIIDGAPGRPPARTVAPGESLTPAWMMVNYAMSHGPAALVMYDAFDRHSGAYVGSVVGESAVDCIGGVATRGCLSATFRVHATAAATKGNFLFANNSWNCCPPFDLGAFLAISGGTGTMGEPEDTTTTTSTTPVAPATVTAATAVAVPTSPRFTG